MRESGDRRTRIWLMGILCAHFVLCAAYWHFTPFGAPPDEGPHALYTRCLAEEGRLPVFEVEDRGNYEFHQPPLYYAMGVPFYLLGNALGLDEPMMMIRLLSMILGAASILVIYAAVRTAFPEDASLALGAAGFAALLPTHVMVSSSVGNEILAELICGVILLLSIRVALKGNSVLGAVGLGVVLGLAALTKTTCLLFVGVACLAYLLAAHGRKLVAASALRNACISLGVAIIVGGWWLVRNKILYGDPLAWKAFQQAFAHTAKPEDWIRYGLTPTSYILLAVGQTFASFWGAFGHMKVWMPTVFYFVLGAITIAVKLGCLGGSARMWRASERDRDVVLLFAVSMILVAAAFVKFNMSYWQPQGRYLFPALLPISAFWAIGIRRLTPKRISSWSPFIAAGIPLVAQIVALATCIVPRMPFYH